MSMFLTGFNVYFVFGYACFMSMCLKSAVWLFWWQGLAFGEDRLATLISFESFIATKNSCRVPRFPLIASCYKIVNSQTSFTFMLRSDCWESESDILPPTPQPWLEYNHEVGEICKFFVFRLTVPLMFLKWKDKDDCFFLDASVCLPELTAHADSKTQSFIKNQ